MTKEQFKQALAALYACGNRADSHNGKKPDEIGWVKPQMAGQACCAKLDEVVQG
jgi:hypothetical protein